MKKPLIAYILLISTSAFAQVGINTDAPQATLDVTANPLDPTKTDGFLAPRISGDDLAAKDALYTTNQIGALIYATTAAITPTPKTIQVTEPGYYYFDGTVWVSMSVSANENGEPWFDQITNTEATQNTQNIYQIGNVAIGKTNNLSGTALDVNGAVRGGQNHLGVVGANSVGFGYGNVASGDNSVAFGYETTASGVRSTAFGYRTEASGLQTIAFGALNIASGDISTAFGSTNEASGIYSTVFGFGNTASGVGSVAFGFQHVASGSASVAFGDENVVSSQTEFALGRYNAITTGNNVTWTATDALFQIGNGGGILSRSNAVTVLKNGHTGIGINGTEASAKPTEMLDIGAQGVRIRDINTVAYQGNASVDRQVVADPNGVLKTVAGTTPSIHYFSGNISSGGQNINAAVNATASPVNLQFPDVKYTTAVGVTQNVSHDIFTITTAGVYEITTQAQLDAEPATWNGTGEYYLWMVMQVEINKDGSGFQPSASSRTIFTKEAVTTSFTPITTIVSLSAGDQILVSVLRGGGFNRNGGGNALAKFKHLTIKKIQ